MAGQAEMESAIRIASSAASTNNAKKSVVFSNNASCHGGAPFAIVGGLGSRCVRADVSAGMGKGRGNRECHVSAFKRNGRVCRIPAVLTEQMNREQTIDAQFQSALPAASLTCAFHAASTSVTTGAGIGT